MKFKKFTNSILRPKCDEEKKIFSLCIFLYGLALDLPQNKKGSFINKVSMPLFKSPLDNNYVSEVNFSTFRKSCTRIFYRLEEFPH